MPWGIRWVLMAVLASSSAWAQGAAEHVAAGDRLTASLDARGALREYEAALADNPTHYDALCKASRSAVDLGEFEPDEAARTRYFLAGRSYGQRAVAANPQAPTGTLRWPAPPGGRHWRCRRASVSITARRCAARRWPRWPSLLIIRERCT